MNKYKNGKIYTIRSYQTDLIYIGSTRDALFKRLSYHKQDYKTWINNNKKYMTSFEICKFDDVYIELLLNYPCNDRGELCRKEGEFIRSMECVNKQIAGRTSKQYKIDNKEQVREQRKQYRLNNADRIKAQNKQYRLDNYEKQKSKTNCECGGKYQHKYKAKHFKTKKHVKYLNNIKS